MTVHILHHGLALCGQPGFASTWPKGHSWVRVEERPDATCPLCIAEYDRALAGIPPGHEQGTMRVIRFTAIVPPGQGPGAVKVYLIAQAPAPDTDPRTLTSIPRLLVYLGRYAKSLNQSDLAFLSKDADLNFSFDLPSEAFPKLFEIIRL